MGVDGQRPQSVHAGTDDRSERAKDLIADLRARLLDLTTRNRLLNFRFGERVRQVRIVNEVPDVLFKRLVSGRPQVFRALPDIDPSFEDEAVKDELGNADAVKSSTNRDPAIHQQTLIQIHTSDERRHPRENSPNGPQGRRSAEVVEGRKKDDDKAKIEGWAKEQRINPSYELPTDVGDLGDGSPPTSNSLQLLLFPKQTDRKLGSIREGARIALSDMGINILFLAFGFLEWTESADSDKKYFAPLLLHPVDMHRKLVSQRYRYSISSSGEETMTNDTLRTRLRNDFGLWLPAFDESDTPEGYWDKVREVIKDQKGWKIRRFVALGLFPFGRIAMYHDLDPERWPKNRALHRHPLLLDLLAGGQAPETLIAEDYETDAPEIAAKVPVLIADADSSQFSAIADAMDGRNLVIQGPPGTGKSQTITNIIAAALHKGKRVLFMAEKMAALEVVKKRLDDAGLGKFCLELHSTKARRAEVVASLRRRLEMDGNGPPSEAEELEVELQDLIRQLHQYDESLNAPVGAMGMTLQEAIWAYLQAWEKNKAFELPTGLHRIRFAETSQTTQSEFNRRVGAMQSLAELSASIEERYGAVVLHPWFGVNVSILTPFEQEEFVTRVSEWFEAVAALQRAVAKLAAEGIQLSTLGDVQGVWRAMEILTASRAESCLDILERALREDGIVALRSFHEKLTAYDGSRKDMQEFFTADADLSTSVKEYVERLATTWRALPDHFATDEATLADLKHVRKGIDLLIRDGHGIQAAMDRLNQRLGLQIPATVPALRRLSAARGLVMDLPEHVLRLRRPTLFEMGAGEVLADGADRAEKLRGKKANLGDTFVLRSEEDIEALRDASIVLRSETGFASRLFSRRFRDARNLWRGLRRQPAKLTSAEMADELERLADYHLALKRLREDSQLKQLCGPSFRGEDTDFQALKDTVEFGRSVRRLFPETGDDDFGLRKLLLEAEPEMVTTMAELSADLIERTTLLMDRAPAYAVFAEEPVELGLVLERLTEVFDILDEASRIAETLGVVGGLTLHDLDTLRSLVSKLQAREERAKADEAARQVLGSEFHAAATDRDLVAHVLSIAEELMDTANPEIVTAILETNGREPSRLKEIGRRLEEVLVREEEVRKQVQELASVHWLEFLGDPHLSDTPVTRLHERLLRTTQHASTLPEWVEYRRLYIEAAELGLADVIDEFFQDDYSLTGLPSVYRWLFFRSLLAEAHELRPELRRLSGLRHDTARKRFQQADKQLAKEHQAALIGQLLDVGVPWGNSYGPKKEWTDLALIQNELAKKRTHVPLRELFRRADTAIQALKPCWMMSPASVAHFLDPGRVEFDLVIIDEASQMRPEEALGSIARGRQLLVVGDPMQLPPTDFFRRHEFDVDDEEEDDDEAIDSESILDLAQRTFHPVRRLRWHYRSRHEDLIAFSNKEFYDGSLIIFPSAHRAAEELGVKYVNVGGLYYPGQRVNPTEATAVADAAIDFMKRFPKKSLGIVCVNRAQTDLLLDEMNMRIANDEDAAHYVEKWEGTLEPFFIRNLENVQGDQRDVIFISTVYGPETEGGRVAQRFGPINSRVGHRRLNVLFTRAKDQIKVFSSLEPNDIVTTPTSHRGVRVLQSYLSYAKSGFGSTGEFTGREPDSDFEVFVAERLRTHGYDVVPQVGVDGYFIDIGVVDPDDNTRYLAGIECDGATYHSAKSARDRDRLRQERLENLGWTIYRIWSVDWFADADRETEKLLLFLDGLREKPAQ